MVRRISLVNLSFLMLFLLGITFTFTLLVCQAPVLAATPLLALLRLRIHRRRKMVLSHACRLD
jgi:hypothetical protein